MTAKIEFFFTHGHSFTANNVFEDSVVTNDTHLAYKSKQSKENGDLEITSVSELKLHDLKYAIITYSEDSPCAGVTTIIHGLATKFDVLASFEDAEKIRKLEADQRLEKETIEYKRQREAEKFVKRRQRRSAERKAEREAKK